MGLHVHVYSSRSPFTGYPYISTPSVAVLLQRWRVHEIASRDSNMTTDLRITQHIVKMFARGS